MREIMINDNDSGQRLDKFLKKYMPKLPNSMLYKGIRKKLIRINGKHPKSADIFLNEGDVLRLYFSDEFYSDEKKTIKKTKLPDVVYEDENILVFNKPAGVMVHEGEDKNRETLVSQMLYYLYSKGEYNPDDEKSFSPALCNRLDRNTSGLVIGAKNAKALRFINEKIKSREIKKYYICIVEGQLEKKSGELRASLVRGDKKVSINNSGEGKEIITKYKVLNETDGFSLVEVELITGRTHQIRAQFAEIGHPLRGDTKYGAKKDSEFSYQALCSYRLKFDFKDNDGDFLYMKNKDIKIDIPF